MCKECKYLNKCLEMIAPSEMIFWVLEKYEVICPMECLGLWGFFKKEVGINRKSLTKEELEKKVSK